MKKSKIRKKILKIRKDKFNKSNIINFNKIAKLFKEIGNFRIKVIGGYYPVNYEIDDLNILKEFEKKKIKIALPSIKKDFKMDFIECSLKDPLVVNKYGIPEPKKGNVVYPDVLFVPLVAFDKKLNRLGYGGGFYDRIIEFLKRRKKIVTIGMAFDFQEIFSIPISRHDKKLDYIVTNKNILK